MCHTIGGQCKESLLFVKYLRKLPHQQDRTFHHDIISQAVENLSNFAVPEADARELRSFDPRSSATLRQSIG